MSGVTITGQAPKTDLTILEEEARQACRDAGEYAVAVARGNLRSQGGPLAQGIRAYVTRTATGAAVTVRVVPKQRRVAQYVEHGTGLYHPIRSAKHGPGHPLRTPFGPRAKVKGQRPQRFMARAEQEAQARAEHLLAQGAHRATRRLS